MESRTTRWMAALLLILASVPAVAEDQDLARQIAEVNRNLERISVTLEGLLAHRQVEVAIRRIELAERRLEPLAGRVDDERKWIEALDREIAELRSIHERVESERERVILEGRVPRDEERMLSEIEGRIEQLREQSATHRARELELSADYDRERERIAILDERLLELSERLD